MNVNTDAPTQVWLAHTPGQHQMQRTGQSDPRAVRYVLGADYDALLTYVARQAWFAALRAAANGEPFAHLIDGLLPVEPPVAQELVARDVLEILRTCVGPLNLALAMTQLHPGADGADDARQQCAEALERVLDLLAAPVAAQPAANHPLTTDLDGLAHEIWAAAQRAPSEGIVDGVERIAALLVEHGYPADWIGQLNFEYQRGLEDGRKAQPVSVADELGTQDREDVLTQAAQDVLDERRRQVTAEGWTPEHDDAHTDCAMSRAAVCYALDAAGYSGPSNNFWPWAPEWWRPAEPRRNLVKAGALILAEIERIDRAAARAAKERT